MIVQIVDEERLGTNFLNGIFAEAKWYWIGSVAVKLIKYNLGYLSLIAYSNLIIDPYGELRVQLD
jgi:hypothetical protein